MRNLKKKMEIKLLSAGSKCYLSKNVDKWLKQFPQLGAFLVA